MSDREKQLDFMLTHGYNLYRLDTYTKMISFMSADESFPIYAEIKDEKVQLSSAPLGHAGVITMPYIPISHPEFNAFEDRLVRYIVACMRADKYSKVLASQKIW